MSFGGSVSSMISSLKNNKRSRVNTLKKLKDYKKTNYQKGTIDLKATPEQLQEIRERLEKENKRQQKIKIVFGIACAFIATILFIIFNFVTF